MATKFVRAPNSPVLIAGGIALLLLGALRAGVTAANHFPLSMAVASGAGNVVLGTALLFVVLRGNQFAGATAVIVATFLTFRVVLGIFLSARLSWWGAIDLAIAAIVVGPSLFPWSRTANKSVLFWMGLTIAAATLLIGAAALLARV